eukprot:351595-Chlamydomonas_euryale.AAC.4
MPRSKSDAGRACVWPYNARIMRSPAMCGGVEVWRYGVWRRGLKRHGMFAPACRSAGTRSQHGGGAVRVGGTQTAAVGCSCLVTGVGYDGRCQR